MRFQMVKMSDKINWVINHMTIIHLFATKNFNHSLLEYLFQEDTKKIYIICKNKKYKDIPVRCYLLFGREPIPI